MVGGSVVGGSVVGVFDKTRSADILSNLQTSRSSQSKVFLKSVHIFANYQ